MNLNTWRDTLARIRLARDANADGDPGYVDELLHDLEDDIHRLIVERVVATKEGEVGDQ
jgi:hypothetical protein